MTKKLGLFLTIFMPAVIPGQEIAGNEASGKMVVKALQTLCIDCHSGPKPKGKFDMENLGPKITGPDIQHWENILEMVSIGDMPPEDELQPTDKQRKFLVKWMTSELEALGRGPTAPANAGPHFGNRVNHKDLFSGEYKGPAYTTSRLWRISPSIYLRFASEMKMARKLSAPLQTASGKGFQDYSLLYADESTIQTLLQNNKRVVTTLLDGGMVHGKRGKKNKDKNKTQGGRAGVGGRVKVYHSGTGQSVPPRGRRSLGFLGAEVQGFVGGLCRGRLAA